MFKLAEKVPRLRVVSGALLQSGKGVLELVFLIAIVNFVFAVVGIFLFSENDPRHFHSFLAAFMTMWQVRESESVPSLPAERSHFPTRVPRRVRVTMSRQVETLDGWEKVLYINMYGCERFGYVEHLRATAFTCAARDGGGGGVGTTSASWGACEFEARENVNRHTCYSSVPRGWLAAAYFVTLVVVGALLMPTALIGVISLSFDESRRELADEMASERGARAVLARVNAWARREGPPAARRVAQRNAGPWIAKATERALRALFDELCAHRLEHGRAGRRGAVGGIGGGGYGRGWISSDEVGPFVAQLSAALGSASLSAERVALEARQAAAHASAAGSNARAAARAAAETADAAEAAASQLRARAAALSPDVLGSMYEMAVAGSDDGMVNFAQFLWLCLSIKKSCVLASSGVAVMPKKSRARDALRLSPAPSLQREPTTGADGAVEDVESVPRAPPISQNF